MSTLRIENSKEKNRLICHFGGTSWLPTIVYKKSFDCKAICLKYLCKIKYNPYKI